MRHRKLVARIYALALNCLPGALRAEHGDEILETFEALWEDARTPVARALLAVRTFSRLPIVALAAWRDRPAREHRAPRRGGGLEEWVRTFGYAARSLRRSPSFFLPAALLLALGIGGTTMMYAVVDHVLIRPLPYPQAERLIEIQRGSHSGRTFERLREFGSVELWAAVMEGEARLTGNLEPTQVRQARVNDDFFELFGGTAVEGRLFVPEDFASGSGAVVSFDAWLRIWGGDPTVVGRTVRIDDEPVTVVGVVAEGFRSPEALMDEADIWRPLDPGDERLSNPDYSLLDIAGRMAPGVRIEDVQREADLLVPELAAEDPDRWTEQDGSGRSVGFVPDRLVQLPVVGLQDATVPDRIRAGLGLLVGAVALLHLVACLNLAHLIIARGRSRGREIAVRSALGAQTRTLIAQVSSEIAIVGLAGGALGVALAHFGLGAFLALNPEALPRGYDIAIDLRVTAFALVAGIVSALVFGLLPVLRASRDPAGGTGALHGRRTDGRGAGSFRRILVVSEVALSLVLIAQAFTLARSFANLEGQALGFRVDRVWTLPVTPTGVDSPESWVARMDAVREALATTPGVSSATYGLTMPLQYFGDDRCCWNTDVTFEGAVAANRTIHPVDAEYFTTLGIESIAGQPFSRDGYAIDPLPVVLSEALAMEVFGEPGDAVGRSGTMSTRSITVVGVVEDNLHYGPGQEDTAALYVPPTALPFALGRANFAVLAAAEDPSIPELLRQSVWQAEPTLPVPVVVRLADRAGETTATARFESVFISTFGGAALLLVVTGLYGTLLYSVGRRRRELGIRVALGAAPGRVRGTVLSEGVILALAGSALGVAGAFPAGRLLEGRVFGVETWDPLTLAWAAGMLVLVSLLASWLPARRANHVDPIEALRAE